MKDNKISQLTLEVINQSAIKKVNKEISQATFETSRPQKAVSVFDTESGIIVFYDNQLRVIWTDEYTSKIFNITQHTSYKKCYEIFHELNMPCPNCPVIKTLKTGKEQVSNIIIDGKKFLYFTYPFKDTSGNISGVIGIIRKSLENEKNQIEALGVIDFKKLLTNLTKREREIMQLVADGLSNKMISLKLGISPKTVEIHRGRVMAKLKIDSVAQLVRYITEYEIFNPFLIK